MMKTNQRSIFSTLFPIIVSFLWVAVIGLACSNSKSGPASTRTPKGIADQADDQVIPPKTPLVTQRVYSPMVGSGATPIPTPGVKISVNPVVLQGGETVTITVTIKNIEAPSYLLFVRDRGIPNASKTIGVTDENIPIPGKSTSQVLEVISTHGSAEQAIFVLRALLDGTTDVWVSVITGGVTSGTATGWVSDTVQVKVGK
jgi:hypothetical protein